MFNNIGSKIKGLATFLFWMTAIIALLAGIIVIFIGIGFGSDSSNGSSILSIFSGIGIAVGGFILAWIQNFLLYGFGELIDSNQKILQCLEKNKI